MRFLSFLHTLNYWFWNALKWLAGAGKKTTKLPAWVYHTIHILVIALITILLAVFSDGVYKFLTGSETGPELAARGRFVENVLEPFYCGVVFLVGYLFVRLVVVFVQLFLLREQSQYPEIDAAWAAGLKGLAKGGIDLHSVPVFLIAGLTDKQEAFFFSGVRFNADVVAPGPDGASPLRFYANREAIFIVCHGVSAVCEQLNAPAVAGGVPTHGGMPLGAATSTLQPGQGGSGQTMQPGAAGGSGMTMQPGQSAASGATMQPAGSGGSVQTLKPGGGGESAAPAQSRSPATAMGGVAAQGRASLTDGQLRAVRRRMQYFCRLLSETRMPFCPVNGLLMTVPLEWVCEDNQRSYAAVRQDLQVLHEDLQMLFPSVCLLDGLQSLGGLEDFITRSREVNARFGPHARAGSHFPTGHEIDAAAADWVSENAVNWFRSWIYSAFAKALANPTNARLYRMLCRLYDAQPRLSKLLQATFGEAVYGDVARLSGCYFCGFDPGSRRYVFVKDIIDKLINEQDDVAWTWNRVRKDMMLRGWSYVLYVAIGLLVLLNGFLLYQRMN